MGCDGMGFGSVIEFCFVSQHYYTFSVLPRCLSRNCFLSSYLIFLLTPEIIFVHVYHEIHPSIYQSILPPSLLCNHPFIYIIPHPVSHPIPHLILSHISFRHSAAYYPPSSLIHHPYPYSQSGSASALRNHSNHISQSRS